jgi:hypothetical protein
MDCRSDVTTGAVLPTDITPDVCLMIESASVLALLAYGTYPAETLPEIVPPLLGVYLTIWLLPLIPSVKVGVAVAGEIVTVFENVWVPVQVLFEPISGATLRRLPDPSIPR